MGKPVVKLVGEDGNVFNIIGKVSKALKRKGKRDEVREFEQRAFSAGSYDEVLILAHEYAEVE